MRGLLFALQLIILCVGSRQSRDCRKHSVELSSEGPDPGPSSAHGRLQLGQGRLGGRAASAASPGHGDAREPATALHTPACSACTIWGMRDTRGCSGSCRLHQTPGGCYKGRKIFSTSNFQTLHRNLTQDTEKNTDTFPSFCPPSQVGLI